MTDESQLRGSQMDEIVNDVKERVLWWITDMAYKPPEVTTPAYFEYMTEDIAEYAFKVFVEDW